MNSTLPDKLHPLAVLGKAAHPQGGLQGYCITTFGLLCTLLGEPHIYSSDKINAEWAFRCKDGTVFTVYDWKLPSIPVNEYAWHIGGSGRPLQAFMRHTGLKATPYTDFPSELL